MVWLDLAAGNYAQWRPFLLTVIGKFGLSDHTAVRRVDGPERVMIDHTVVHWLYITVSPELLDVVMQPEDTCGGHRVGGHREHLPRQPALARRVHRSTRPEYHAVVQGDMSILQ
jgi:hypothetical protein